MNPETEARKVLESVLNSSCSDFYRTHYKKNFGGVYPSLLSGNYEWNEVPFLKREHIAETSLKERLFVPFEELGAIRVTSGTSGKGAMIMGRFAGTSVSESLIQRNYRALNLDRHTSITGLAFVYSKLHLEGKETPARNTLCLDPGDHIGNEQLVREYKPELIIGTAHGLATLAGGMSIEDREVVKALLLVGEWTSRVQNQFLHSLFPKALIMIEYASIEAQTPIAVSCIHQAKKESLHVHPMPEYVHLELIDELGNSVEKEGQGGEVVVTVLRQVPFPLVRYRTGDFARIIRAKCPCGDSSPLIQVEGRIEYFSVRIHGGEIHLAMVEQVLADRFAGVGLSDFQVAVRDVLQNREVVPCLEFRVLKEEKELLPEDFEQSFSGALQISPNATYQDFVESGKALPMRLAVLEKRDPTKKRLHLVREGAR